MDGEYVESTIPEVPEAPASSLSPALSVDVSAAGGENSTEGSAPAPVEDTVPVEDTGGGSDPLAEVNYNAQLTVIQESLTAIQTHMARPLMTTPFEEYTVGEGLILLLLVFLILQSLIKMVKVGFSWLLW